MTFGSINSSAGLDSNKSIALSGLDSHIFKKNHKRFYFSYTETQGLIVVYKENG